MYSSTNISCSSTTSITKSISADLTANILSLFEQGHPADNISESTGVHTSTVFWLWNETIYNLPKSSDEHPSIYNLYDMRHAIRLISTRRADNTVQVNRTLQDVKNTSISTQTTRRLLKKAGMKAVVKKKRPLLDKRHRKNELDWAMEHKD